MAQFIAIVAYRCLIAGASHNSLDLQVQWFDETDEDAVRKLIAADPIHCYKNSDNDTVSWELVEIFSVEAFAPKRSGEEVAGFIASPDELAELA